MVDFSRLILNNNDFLLVTCVFMNARLFIDFRDLDCQQRRLKLHTCNKRYTLIHVI